MVGQNIQQQLKRYSQLSVALSQAASESQAAEIVVTLGCSLLEASAGGMWVAKKNTQLQLLSHIGRKRQDFDTLASTLTSAHKIFSEVCFSQEEIAILDVASLKKFPQLYEYFKNIAPAYVVAGFRTRMVYGYIVFVLQKSKLPASFSKEILQSCLEQFLRITERQTFGFPKISSMDVTRKLVSLQKITSLLSRASTKERVGEIMIKEGFHMIGASVGEVAYFNERSQTYDMIAQVGYPHKLAGSWPTTYSLKGKYLTNKIILEGKPLFITNIDTIDKKYKIMHGIIRVTGICSESLVPLRVGHKVIGSINFYYTTPQFFSEFDKQILFMLARQCAQALDRVISRESLERSRVDMEKILLKVGEGVVIRDKNGEILFANYEAQKIYGINSENEAENSFKTSQLLSLKDEDGNEIDKDRFQYEKILQQPMVYEKDMCITWKNGENQWIRVKSFPIMHNKTLQNIVDILQDITDLKQKELIKEEFISIASHELKTPLTSLTLYLQAMESFLRNNEHNKATDILRKASDQTHRIALLVKDMLDITKMKYGASKVKKSHILLEKLVKETVEEFQQTTATHTIQVRGRANGKVLGNKEKIRQVIINLLSNAVKYSPNAKRIDVSISQNHQGIKICITDFGVGIQEKEIGSIFKPFVRAQSHQKLQVPGMGLGLYIAFELIKAHKGKLWVKRDQYKKQTSFCFLLPLSN